MQIAIQLLQPIVVLVIWTMVMWCWMYATRLPAIASMEMDLDPEAPSGIQMSQLPAKVRWKADNYNHLLEQPNLFYTITLSLAFLGLATELNIYAAWAYVGLRVIHSLVQALLNNIKLRFALFFLSNIALLILIYSAVKAVL